MDLGLPSRFADWYDPQVHSCLVIGRLLYTRLPRHAEMCRVRYCRESQLNREKLIWTSSLSNGFVAITISPILGAVEDRNATYSKHG